MRKGIRILSITVILFFTVASANAQFGAPGSGGSAPGGGGAGGGIPGSGGAVPFDGGLSLVLLAMGAGVGARKRNILQNA